MVIAIDFDGCITEKNIFPEIGKAREHAFEAIRHFQKLGHKCILWTCRYGQSLIEAINWLSKNNVKMDAYNENLYPLQSRKIVADVYIDDKNVFMVDGVDWYKIEEYVLSLGNKETKIIKGENDA
jgi:hypothetical protein